MAKIYCIKTGKEIFEAPQPTARQLADRLSVFEYLLREEGYYDAADSVRRGRAKLMPTVISERRNERRFIKATKA